MNLNTQLRIEKENWDIKKNFEKEPIDIVYSYLKELRKTKPEIARYNSAMKDYILEKEKVDSDLERHLLTEIYLSQKKLEKVEKEEYKNKMIKNGWIELTEDIIKKAKEEGKKILVNAIAQNDWATIKIDKTYKPAVFGERLGLMDLRARTRGYNLSQFEDAFCKIV